MSILVTGAAGFIGMHVCKALLERGESIIGIDNLNTYYDLAIKHGRLSMLDEFMHFKFLKLDFSDKKALQSSLEHRKITKIIHLGAQAGVRYSIENPDAYILSNIVGHVNILELARHAEGLEYLVYASSSSVYGEGPSPPFVETQATDAPVSLYAATKKSGEILSQSYSHLYGIPMTGLRFFTVYGPWGRPDMAYWRFTKALLEGRPITLFNEGNMRRDFTFIDDIVAGVLGCLDNRPDDTMIPDAKGSCAPHKIYNIGNNQAENILDVVKVLEMCLGIKAIKLFKPKQLGDMVETCADISAAKKDIGYTPKTTIYEGLPKFVAWYRQFYSI